jgi:hypothetical protein
MYLPGHLCRTLSLRSAILLLLPLFLLSVGPRDSMRLYDSSQAIEALLSSRDPFDQIARDVTLRGLARQGADLSLLQRGDVDVCLHPDTSPEDAERILRELPTYVPGNELLGFWIRGRWVWTATDGGTGTTGDPITITWSFVPDGTWADGGPSDLFAKFDAAFGGSGWMNKIRNAFDRWEAVIGITYVETSDDGANMPGSSGVLGVRGDIRIAGRSMDGPGNVLGYSYYPSAGGDTFLDTDDTALYANPLYNYGNLKNVICHEHGHGIGLGHVIPNDCTKLMEAYLCGPSYGVGPMDDDIRGGMRNYGDPYENNDTNAEPADLGTVTDTLVIENLSIDRGTTDIDWYLITLTETGIMIEVDPIGSTYLLGNEGGSTSWVSTDSISDPDIELYDATGTTLLASATSAGIGETEVLSHTVPSAGDYQVCVYRKEASGNGVQRYTMTIYYDDQGGVLTQPDLAFSVHPNPFSLQTTTRFLAPSAGPYRVEVFDVTGRLSRVIDGYAPSAGWVEAVWDGRNGQGGEASSGMYFIRVISGDQTESRRVLLVR